MTKVGRLFEQEKHEAVEQAKKEAVEQGKKERTIELAKLLLDVLSPKMVAEKTGLDIQEVLRLKNQQ